VSDALGGPVREDDQRLPLAALYLRVVALILLAAGLARAALVLGMIPGGPTFADLSSPWRTGAPILILIDLFAAVGLWMGATWGPVMWAVALAVEVSMYTVFSHLFGTFPWRVAAHCLVFAGFLVLLFIRWRANLSD
jgi:hypothetical protein